MAAGASDRSRIVALSPSGTRRCGELSTTGIELGSSGDRGLVDPVTADSLGEHVEGGLVVFDGDVDVVGVSPAGHRCVDPCVAWLVWA